MNRAAPSGRPSIVTSRSVRRNADLALAVVVGVGLGLPGHEPARRIDQHIVGCGKGTGRGRTRVDVDVAVGGDNRLSVQLSGPALFSQRVGRL